MVQWTMVSVAPWTVAHHVPLSMDSPGKNTGVSYHCPLQGISLTQGSRTLMNPHLCVSCIGREVLYPCAT